MAARKSLTLAQHIASKREQMRTLRESIKLLESQRDRFDAAYALLAPITKGADWTYNDPMAYSNWDGTVDASLRVLAEFRTNDLRGELITRKLQQALDLGLETVESTDHASEYSANRDFKFTTMVAGIKVYLTIRAEIVEGGPCRKVQVGTKLVEEAVYELRCEE